MIGLSVKAAKGGFFNGDYVMATVTKAKIKSLSKGGAMVRRTARTSIRKRKRISTPGEPPSSHVGLLRDLLFFSFSPESQSVVVGPALSNAAERLAQPIGATVPGVLERGGVVRRETTKNKRGQIVRRRIIRVKPRPYMQPALVANQDQLAELWKDSLRK